MSDQITLGFDTSAAHVAAAVARGGVIVAKRHRQMDRGQGEALFETLENTLSDAGLGWSDLTRIGVGTGPGNFTGIRISVSAARGLSLSLGVPAIGVSGLAGLAFGTFGTVVATLDAPKNQIYYQEFRDGSPTSDPQIAALEDLRMTPPADAVALGPAATDVAIRLGLFDAPAPHSTAEAIALAAAAHNGSIAPPKPEYVRAPDAAPGRHAAPVLLGAP